MSRLSVYWPDELFSSDDGPEESMILPFPGVRQAASAEAPAPALDVITRARLLFSNRSCQECGYPVVEPVEMSDSLVNRNGLAIPGTATLTGFRCCGCDHEWSI